LFFSPLMFSGCICREHMSICAVSSLAKHRKSEKHFLCI
jgi:hypothetical protein